MTEGAAYRRLLALQRAALAAKMATLESGDGLHEVELLLLEIERLKRNAYPWMPPIELIGGLVLGAAIFCGGLLLVYLTR